MPQYAHVLQPPASGINPARLALINGGQPAPQQEAPPSEPPVPVPAKKKEVAAVVLSEQDALVVARMENKQWKSHRCWDEALINDGPIALVVGVCSRADVCS